MAKTKTTKQKVTFSYKEPSANSVLLAGEFTEWERAPLPMKKSKTGVWTTAVTLSPGSHQYRLIVDGEWRDDPACTLRQANQFGSENCVRVVQDGSATVG